MLTRQISRISGKFFHFAPNARVAFSSSFSRSSRNFSYNNQSRNPGSSTLTPDISTGWKNSSAAGNKIAMFAAIAAIPAALFIKAMLEQYFNENHESKMSQLSEKFTEEWEALTTGPVNNAFSYAHRSALIRAIHTGVLEKIIDNMAFELEDNQEGLLFCRGIYDSTYEVKAADVWAETVGEQIMAAGLSPSLYLYRPGPRKATGLNSDICMGDVTTAAIDAGIPGSWSSGLVPFSGEPDIALGYAGGGDLGCLVLAAPEKIYPISRGNVRQEDVPGECEFVSPGLAPEKVFALVFIRPSSSENCCEVYKIVIPDYVSDPAAKTRFQPDARLIDFIASLSRDVGGSGHGRVRTVLADDAAVKQQHAALLTALQSRIPSSTTVQQRYDAAYEPDTATLIEKRRQAIGRVAKIKFAMYQRWTSALQQAMGLSTTDSPLEHGTISSASELQSTLEDRFCANAEQVKAHQLGMR